MAATDPVNELADTLLGAETPEHLMAQMEDALPMVGAAPAVLFLLDRRAHAFYAAVGIGCAADRPDIPETAPLPAGHHPLVANGETIGLLAVDAGALPDPRLFPAMLALLGPVIVRLHRHQGTLRELREAHELLARVESAGDLLRHLDVEVLLAKVLETMLGAVRAQVGAILLPDAAGKLAVRVGWGLTGEHLDAIRTADGRPLCEAVFASGQPLFSSGEDLRWRLDLSQLDARLDAVLALALSARDRVLGVVVMGNPEQGFGPGQRRIAETLASLAATAIDNALLVQDAIERERLRQEIDIARSVQTAMFPTAGLSAGELSIEGLSHPCSETGGDYLTFLPRGREVVAMIGDVSGHGLGAALFTTMAHALVQQQLRAGVDLPAAARTLNEGLFHTHSGRFMTAAVVAVDAADGSMRYVSAGHNPLLWVGVHGVRWLDSTAMPLGIAPDLEIDPVPPLRLMPGDLLVLYTDGITEATAGRADGECFGDARLAEVVQAAWREGLHPAAVLRRVTAAVDAFAAGHALADDITAVVVARRALPGGAGWGGPPG